MAESRTAKSIKNLFSGFFSRFFTIMLGMLVRTVFIKRLGNNYLSINGLYSNILNMLSLAELGFSTAMVYSMYRPLSENNHEELASLLDLYKKAYRIIGIVIFMLGMALVPFLSFLIKDPPNIDHLTFYYILFLANTSVSYLCFSYKRSIIIADQKEYITTIYRTGFHVIKTGFQIIVLLVFSNFTLYLLVQLICTIGENLAIAHKADRLYPALQIKKPERLNKIELQRIARDIKALMVSRIAHIILSSSDNLIISSLVSIYWVGILSNYTLIIDSITSVLCQITSALSASLGNYFVEKTNEEGYRLFKRIEFLNSWFYGICSIHLIILLNPFILFWIGIIYMARN